jgi:hypothetical protein
MCRHSALFVTTYVNNSFSVNRKRMRLRSAFEDLTNSTLRAFSGILAKLEYLSSLREGASYAHWGLASVYGEKAAQDALSQAHHFIFSEILRTPLRELMKDVEQSSSRIGLTPGAYLNHLRNSTDKLVPGGPGSGARQHFSSVLYALSNLEKSRRAAIPPIS